MADDESSAEAQTAAQLTPALRDRFVAAMSHAAATVNIVTTDGAAGRMGVTVSAMSSVSADGTRPTLLVCVHSASPAAKAIIENGVFCVNVLRDDQAFISDTFAGRYKDRFGDKFECTAWHGMPSGSPRVIDPLVAFDCRVISSDRIGTHHVVFGEVDDIFTANRGSPLIYANRSYGTASRIDRVAPTAGTLAEGETLTIGCFHTFGPYILPDLIRRLRASEPTLSIRLVEGDQRHLEESLIAGETDVALLYDLGLSASVVRRPLTRLHTYVLLPDGHPLTQKSQVAPKDLAGEPMVLLDAPPSRDFFCETLRAAGVEPNIAFRSRSFETVRGMVGHGLGYALLATKPASAMTYDGRALVTRPLLTDAEASPVVLATRKGEALTPAAQHFANLCDTIFATAG